MKYVGIDPSLTGTGVCVLGNDPLTPYVETIVTAKKDFPYQLHRYVTLAHKVGNIIEEYAQESIICIEGYSFGSRGAAVFSLAEYGGILRREIAERFGEYYEVPPTVLKKFITGKGNANKNIVLEKTFRKFGVGSEILKDDNQVDAYGLAHFSKNIINESLSKDFINKYSYTKWDTNLCRKW